MGNCSWYNNYWKDTGDRWFHFCDEKDWKEIYQIVNSGLLLSDMFVAEFYFFLYIYLFFYIFLIKPTTFIIRRKIKYKKYILFFSLPSSQIAFLWENPRLFWVWWNLTPSFSKVCEMVFLGGKKNLLSELMKVILG